MIADMYGHYPMPVAAKGPRARPPIRPDRVPSLTADTMTSYAHRTGGLENAMRVARRVLVGRVR
jgi:hypothetical protein